MFNNKTIRFRVSLMALLIMTFTVLMILFGYYVLQKQGQRDMMIQQEDIRLFQDNGNGGLEPIITKMQERYQTSQMTLFMQMLVLSGIVLVLGSMLIYLVIKKELRTLEELKKRLHNIDFQKENNLIYFKASNEEMEALIDAFNNMMEKLQHAYLLQKRFAQNAAHELKTPITVMMTSIQVEKITNQQSEETMPLLVTLEKQVMRLSALIEGLLRLNNRTELITKKVDVHKMIESLLKDQLSRIHDKNLTIHIDGQLVLETDETYLYGVIKNVLENAIIYNVEDGALYITLTKTSIIIEDTGIGIPKDLLTDVFSPFYCIDDSRAKINNGYGLGLSIVESYLKKLKYSYDIESEENKGTVFKINYN